MSQSDRKVYVVGHKNPDTDSICSSIAYAHFKCEKTKEDVYEPRRAGEINRETAFVLDYFHAAAPEQIFDVRPQVKDIEIRRVKGVDVSMSLKNAWKIMKQDGLVTLPIVTKNNHLSGLITVSDITMLNMDVYDNELLARANTPYANIIDTLEGRLVVGDADAVCRKGKVLIAAANPDLMENYIDEGDIVILGNRYESQLSAIEMNAKCLIVCLGADVSQSIQKLAQEHHCQIIVTEFDTLTAARIISQSIPVGYCMKSENLITFSVDDYVDDIRETMAKVRHRDFPILNGRRFIGMISRRNLLGMKRKQVILVDHNERTQAVDGISSAEILEIIDHHRLGTIETMSPVFFRNQPLGCTATIIYQMYQEQGIAIPKEIAGLLCSAIISDTLLFRSPTCTQVDRMAAEALAKTAGLDMGKFAREMFAAGSNLKTMDADRIFHQDMKHFDVSGQKVAIAQINSMNPKEFKELRAKLLPYMEQYLQKNGLDMVFCMLTSILEESTEVIYAGEDAEETVAEAFGAEAADGSAYLPKVVSRKKQFLPGLMNVMESL